MALTLYKNLKVTTSGLSAKQLRHDLVVLPVQTRQLFLNNLFGGRKHKASAFPG
jgi:hypothetical protein